MHLILRRYLASEMLKTSLVTALVLFVILMANLLGTVLSQVAGGKLPSEALWPLMMGQSIEFLVLLLPFSFFLGMLMALGRLYRDQEFIVMLASGFDYVDLSRTVLWLLTPFFILIAFSSIWFGSYLLHQANNAIEQQKNTNQFLLLQPGQFNTSNNGNTLFYMQSMSEDKTSIFSVLIADKQGAGSLETAAQGQLVVDENTDDLFLTMGPGFRYEGINGDQAMATIEFEEHGVLLRKNASKPRKPVSREKTLPELIDSEDPKDQAEWLWRINIPITFLVLGLIAVPLSKATPRQNRLSSIIWAVVIFMLYLNLLVAAKFMLEEQNMPLWLNYWWVHVLFLTLYLWLMKKRGVALKSLVFSSGQ